MDDFTIFDGVNYFVHLMKYRYIFKTIGKYRDRL